MLIVKKFGGTSLATPERIKLIAHQLVEQKKAGDDLIIVVSAMGHTTDELIDKAMSVNDSPDPREMDMLLSTGEQMSCALMSMAIKGLGVQAISMTGGMSGITTDMHHKKARITDIDSKKILNKVKEGYIVVIAGFQGVTTEGAITTLGRGGSDTTAVAIAASCSADLCEIYTDVDGVYSADPRKVKTAIKHTAIHYDEMLELAKLGAGVLHPRSVEMAQKYNVNLVVRSSFENIPGTHIRKEQTMEQVVIRGVTMEDEIARLTVSEVPDQPGVAFRLFSQLAKSHIAIDMIIQNYNHNGRNDMSFTVSRDDLKEAREVCTEFLKGPDMSGSLDVKENIAKISIVGTGILSSAETASKVFGTLSELGINIEMISTSELKLSVLIPSENSLKALNSIHESLFYD